MRTTPEQHITIGEEVLITDLLAPDTLNIIDSELERIVEEAEARAEYTLRANWDAVRETAQALVEHETLSGVALDAVLSTVQPVDIASIPLPVGDTDARRRGLS